MHITHLSLRHFRNYSDEEVAPAPGANLFLGDNAQGKSNLIEAIVLLSTTRSFRTSTERHLINRAFLDEPIVHSRLRAEVEGSPHRLIELVVTVESDNGSARARKHLRLDGVQHRLMDALGTLPTVLFTPEDVSLVAGPPAGRRHFLDVLLCQASRPYCRALSVYNRSLAQRNHLLRMIRARHSDRDQLAYWDQSLARSGAVVIGERAQALALMSQSAAGIHASLADGEELSLTYVSGTPLECGPDAVAELGVELEERYESCRATDLERGITSEGPHRDDFATEIGGLEAGAFASRGQLRTAALTLRLAEAQYLEQTLGLQPVLLFDDVMSELDWHRRRALESAMLDSTQSFTTGLDTGPFSEAFLERASVFEVAAAHLEPVNPPRGAASPEPPPAEDTEMESDFPF